MNYGNVIRFFLLGVAYCSILMFAGEGRAQDQVTAELENRGRMALTTKQYATARELFSEGAAIATDPAVKARFDFRQAVALQQMASSGRAENPEESLKQAAGLYQSYLEQNPKSSATANNLAKVYQALGDAIAQSTDDGRAGRYYSRADNYYKMAVSANDANKGLYLKNYAEFLEGTGNWGQAKKTYEQLVRGYPVSPALQRSLTASYSKHGLNDMAEFLWNLQNAGYARQSAEISLSTLRQSANDSDEHRIELLTIVCAALAEGTDERNGFAESGMGRQIAALSSDKYIGDGAVEILDLFRGDNLQPSNYDWWAGLPLGWNDPERGLYPIDGVRALIRSLGSRSKRTGDLQLAESYFLLAARLKEYELDPVAIRDLVRMYAEHNEFEKINGVLNNFQIELYAGKGEAYRSSQVEKIFQYHQTLGELYTLIERWGDGSRVDSAIFQLEHARTASLMLAEKSGEELPQVYQFSPQMVDQLSRGYEKTGRMDMAIELRIDQAETYKKSGDTKDAIRVLTPIQELELPSTVSSHHRGLLESQAQEGLIELKALEVDKLQ